MKSDLYDSSYEINSQPKILESWWPYNRIAGRILGSTHLFSSCSGWNPWEVFFLYKLNRNYCISLQVVEEASP